jgi:hypothetical protein
MTFEEFFKKKKIDLAKLELADAGLFLEFKTHYEQMGEKSFDHSKKYWFNKLRRQFPQAPEIKIEKAHIANPIAEQTVAESLSETVAAPGPKLGFVPKFKAANVAKPAVPEVKDEEKAAVSEDIPIEKPAETETPKQGYKPRFNMKNILPKTTEE